MVNNVGAGMTHGGPSTHESRASERLVLTAEELADLLGISRAHLFRLHSRGLVPRPLRLGRSLRWDRATIVRWLAAGAPPRERWESMQAPRRKAE